PTAAITSLCWAGHPRPLHTFPPRRSSDLPAAKDASAKDTEAKAPAKDEDAKDAPAKDAPAKGASAKAKPAAKDAPATDEGGKTADRKSTRLNSSHQIISYAVFCLKKKQDT